MQESLPGLVPRLWAVSRCGAYTAYILYFLVAHTSSVCAFPPAHLAPLPAPGEPNRDPTSYNEEDIVQEQTHLPAHPLCRKTSLWGRISLGQNAFPGWEIAHEGEPPCSQRNRSSVLKTAGQAGQSQASSIISHGQDSRKSNCRHQMSHMHVQRALTVTLRGWDSAACLPRHPQDNC